jgi:speckle-type POZ protein
MQAAGDKWTIEVMPGGISHSDNPGEEAQRCSELVAIFLRYKGDSEAIRVKFSITLVNQLPGKADGTSKADGADNDVVVTFATGMGFPTFVKRCELEDESNGFKLNDRVIFRATITTIGDLETTVAAAVPAFTPPNTLSVDLKAMLTTGRTSDIALYVGHREFNAHRFVLCARSPYFEGLFASTMRDAAADGHTIPDTEPDVFEQLLLWLYTGEVAEGALQAKGMLEHLLMAANRYECGGLKLLCEAKLCEGLTVENASTRLVLGEQAEADQLKESCLEFIKPNVAAVMGAEGWKDVVSAGGELMSEMMAFVHGAPTATKKRTADEAGLSAQDQEVEEMREWRVAQLCGALHGRELSTKGRKKELVERLERAIRVDGKEAGESDSSGCSSSGGSSSSASGPSAVQ